MSFTIEGFNEAKSKMLGAFNEALAQAETLRKADKDAAGGKPAGVAGTNLAEASPAAATAEPPAAR